MIPVVDVMILICIHFVADFILQPDEMAKKKSSSNKWLFFHVITYMIPFLLWFGPLYALVNGIAHYITDYITSRISSEFWRDGKVHQFFVTIGADQAIHMVTLVLTYVWLIK